MHKSHDTTIDHDESHAGGTVGAALRALFARLGAPGSATIGHPYGFDVMLEGAIPMPAEALRRLDRRAPESRAAEDGALRRTRENARAAYRCVDGGGDAALEAAFAVFSAEFAALRAECARKDEALKTVRLYASEASIRAIANDALAPGDPAAASLPTAYLPWNRRPDA